MNQKDFDAFYSGIHERNSSLEECCFSFFCVDRFLDAFATSPFKTTQFRIQHKLHVQFNSPNRRQSQSNCTTNNHTYNVEHVDFNIIVMMCHVCLTLTRFITRLRTRFLTRLTLS